MTVKLDPTLLPAIFKMWNEGWMSQTKIGMEVGLGTYSIYRIINGLAWKKEADEMGLKKIRVTRDPPRDAP